MSITDAAPRGFAGIGWDAAGGAVPLPQVIRRQVEDPVAVGILGGEIPRGRVLGGRLP